MVLSIIAYLLLPSAARCSKTRSHTPALAQRLNRRCVFFQSPKRSGRSRHGIPARYLYSTASTKRRLSRAIAHHSRADAGKWRAIRRGRSDRLNPWFLVVRDDGEAPATAVLALVLPAFSLATHHRHLPVDTEDFGHFGLELRIALLQVVAHLVRPHFLLGQYFADRSLGQLSQARMPGGWSMLPGMCGEQPGRPQLVRITQLLGLPARQRHQPSLCLSRDNGISSRARPIIQCLDHPQFCRSLQAACHCL